MPLDIMVEYTDGSKEFFYIPQTMMRWEKPNPYPEVKSTTLKDWGWAHPTFTFEINKPKSDIKSIVIDPSELMADVNREDNSYSKK